MHRTSEISVLDTLVTIKRDLGSDLARQFITDHDSTVILEILGLPGARNVMPVITTNELSYLRESDEDIDVILQEKQDLTRYTQMTADLLVMDDAISISNVRKILLAEGELGGRPDRSRGDNHEGTYEKLIVVGKYERQQGYMALVRAVAQPQGF